MTRNTTPRATAPNLTRLATIVAIVATVLLIVMARTVAAGHTDTDGLFYDDFDDDTVSEGPDDWTRSDRDDGDGTIEVTDSQAHVGSQIMHLINGSGDWTAIRAAPVVFAPGFVVGVLAATGRVRVSYGQIWAFSLTSWFATLVLLSATGSNQLTADRGVVLACWLVGLLVGGIVAGRRGVRD